MSDRLVSIGDVEGLVATAYSGFAYPQDRKKRLRLLSPDPSTSGNEVIQETAKPYRDATLSILVETDEDRDTLRGYEEASAPVDFVDELGDTRSVLVLSFGSSKVASGTLWDATLVLIELTGPIAAGS